MKGKGLTKTFMMISNWKQTSGLYGLYEKYFSALRVNPYNAELIL